MFHYESSAIFIPTDHHLGVANLVGANYYTYLFCCKIAKIDRVAMQIFNATLRSTSAQPDPAQPSLT